MPAAHEALGRERAGGVEPYSPTGARLRSAARLVRATLFGLSALVLLVVGLNISGMMLARSAIRERELAVRLAIGASRWRLARYHLVEAFVLALFGGAFASALLFVGPVVVAWAFGMFGPALTDVGFSPAGLYAARLRLGPDAKTDDERRIFLRTVLESLAQAPGVTVLDFGLATEHRARASDEETRMATSTEPGTLLGTFAYMSPEQARGETPLTARSDQFALGLVLYDLAAGRRAFTRSTTAETMTAIIREDPEPLPATTPAPLRWVIERLLAKDPADRYDSTRDLYRELRVIRDRLSEGSGGTSASAEPARARRRAGRGVALGAAGCARRRRVSRGTAAPFLASAETPAWRKPRGRYGPSTWRPAASAWWAMSICRPPRASCQDSACTLTGRALPRRWASCPLTSGCSRGSSGSTRDWSRQDAAERSGISACAGLRRTLSVPPCRGDRDDGTHWP